MTKLYIKSFEAFDSDNLCRLINDFGERNEIAATQTHIAINGKYVAFVYYRKQ